LQPNWQDRGCSLLDSMCRNGLLLVPELVSWSDPTQSDSSNRINAVQRRICFTELSTEELPEHIEAFGGFCLEFTIESLRALGALPVIYVPDKISDTSLHDAVGTSMLANLAASAAVLSSFAEFLTLAGPTTFVDVTMRATGIKTTHNFDVNQTIAIRQFLEAVAVAQGIPFHEMRNALHGMSSLFYPTENNKYTDSLGYYRQREWCIFSGPYVNGEPTTFQATDIQAEELLKLDGEFFSRQLDFADGRYTLAIKSHFLREIGTRHVLSHARRILVPHKSLKAAAEILERYSITVQVAPI